MILSYSLKLVFLCFAFFFLAHAALGLATWAAGPAAIRLAERLRPRAAARLLFAVRMLPLVVGILALLALCIPSYLWLEPKASTERVGLLCIVAGGLGATIWIVAVFRALSAVIRSLRFKLQCERDGREFDVARESDGVTVVETDFPLLALAGLFRPRLVISRNALNALSSEELDAALRHERVHQESHDNWKRLMFSLAPEILPALGLFAKIEHAWGRFSECAADAEATEGNEQAAVALASALINMAQLGTTPRLPAAASSLVPVPCDLAERIDRLLIARGPQPTNQTRCITLVTSTVASLIMGCLIAVLLSPSAIVVVHEFLERLIS